MQMSLGLPAFWGTWTSHCNAPSMHYLSKLLLYIHAGLAILVTSETEVVAFSLFIQSSEEMPNDRKPLDTK